MALQRRRNHPVAQNTVHFPLHALLCLYIRAVHPFIQRVPFDRVTIQRLLNMLFHTASMNALLYFQLKNK